MSRRLLAAAVLIGAAATLAAQTPSFELNRDPNQIFNDLALVQGDFNNDGKPDIVLGGSSSNSGDNVTLMLGNGDGTFQAPVAVGPTNNTIYDMAAADMNHDGNLDVVALSIGGEFVVFFGNGEGTFQAPVDVATSAPAISLAVGSFFGDGYLDVAVGDENGAIELFKNEGGKNFVLADTIQVGSGTYPGIQRVRTGNIDGSGISDLAVLSGDAAYVLWGGNNGTFKTVELRSYTAPSDLTVGDLNQDGIDDIVVSYTCNPTQTGAPEGPEYEPCAGFDAFFGQGEETTYAETLINDPGVAAATTPVAVDVNGDGIGDIVGASSPSGQGGGGLYVWLGNANGSFSQTPEVWTATSGGQGGLAFGDWNRDGMMDFAMALPGDAETEFFINGGDRAACGTYQISPSVTVCQPVNFTYTPSPVTVQANSYDTTRVTAMQEYIDNQLEYSEDVSSFETTFAEPLGTHSFITKGWDAGGRSFRSDRTVTVYNGTPYPACPTASGTATICLPSGTTSSSPVHILANGWASWITTAAQLYIDGDLVVNNGTTGSSYVDTTQTLSSGSHTLVFKLWDADGDVYTAQKTITVN